MAASQAADPALVCLELACHLLGRAVTACMDPVFELTEPKKVKVDLMQSANQPTEITLRVCDDGVGLPSTETALCEALAPFRRPLTCSPVLHSRLLLRTTRLEESEVRRYHAVASPEGHASSFTFIQLDSEPKPSGLQLTGTQASVTFNTALVTPSDAACCCETAIHTLSMLSPPIQLAFRARGFFETPITSSAFEECQGTSSGSTAAAPAAAVMPPLQAPPSHPVLSSVVYRVEYSSAAATQSPLRRMEAGMLREFPPVDGLLLSFAGMGQASVYPRGCKWTACAGIMLSMPHQDAVYTAPDPATATGTAVPAFVYYDHSLQFSSLDDVKAGLRGVDWAGYGFSLSHIDHCYAGSHGPPLLFLTCNQPDCGAEITGVYVQLYRNTANGAVQPARPGSGGQLKPPPGRHVAALVKSAVGAALEHLWELCPAVMASRRERSLARAMPVIASAAAGILLRAQTGGALAEACGALGTHPVNLVGALQEGLEMVASAGLQAGE